MNKRFARTTFLASLCAAFAFSAWPARAAQRGGPAQAREDFFIISSVNLPKHQLVLKLPTEVTMMMSVGPNTVIVGEKGQKLSLAELRSGDTVYITYIGGAEGDRALKIRIGPMTVAELHKRYLSGYAVPIPPPVATPPAVASPPARSTPPRQRRNPTRPQAGVQRGTGS